MIMLRRCVRTASGLSPCGACFFAILSFLIKASDFLLSPLWNLRLALAGKSSTSSSVPMSSSFSISTPRYVNLLNVLFFGASAYIVPTRVHPFAGQSRPVPIPSRRTSSRAPPGFFPPRLGFFRSLSHPRPSFRSSFDLPAFSLPSTPCPFHPSFNAPFRSTRLLSSLAFVSRRDAAADAPTRSFVPHDLALLPPPSRHTPVVQMHPLGIEGETRGEEGMPSTRQTHPRTPGETPGG
mmetsp:Transcript_2113/g.13758  ORF Transcript_2113/g.13758 Transcript_2113/m.13758 type:complete len:237 (-) Transcript_2113:33-743(-)